MRYRAVLRCGHQVDVAEEHARSLEEDNCHDGVHCADCATTRTISHILNWPNGHGNAQCHIDENDEARTD